MFLCPIHRQRTAIGQHDERYGAALEFRQQIAGAGQNIVAAERAVAQQQRAVQIEQEALQPRQHRAVRRMIHCAVHPVLSVPSRAAWRRSSTRVPDFETAMRDRSFRAVSRRMSSSTGFVAGS